MFILQYARHVLTVMLFIRTIKLPQNSIDFGAAHSYLWDHLSTSEGDDEKICFNLVDGCFCRLGVPDGFFVRSMSRVDQPVFFCPFYTESGPPFSFSAYPFPVIGKRTRTRQLSCAKSSSPELFCCKPADRKKVVQVLPFLKRTETANRHAFLTYISMC